MNWEYTYYVCSFMQTLRKYWINRVVEEGNTPNIVTISLFNCMILLSTQVIDVLKIDVYYPLIPINTSEIKHWQLRKLYLQLNLSVKLIS